MAKSFEKCPKQSLGRRHSQVIYVGGSASYYGLPVSRVWGGIVVQYECHGRFFILSQQSCKAVRIARLGFCNRFVRSKANPLHYVRIARRPTYIAIALELKRRDYEVAIATSLHLREHIENALRMASVAQCTDKRIGEVFVEHRRLHLARLPLQYGKSDELKHGYADRYAILRT